MTKTICDICRNPHKEAKRYYYPIEILKEGPGFNVYKHQIVDICTECEIDALSNVVLSYGDTLECSTRVLKSLDYLKTILETNNKLENVLVIPWRKDKR